MVETSLMDSLYAAGMSTLSFIPTVIAVIIFVLLGWILGRGLGKYGSKILDRIGLDNLIDKTAVGNLIHKSGTTTVKFFESVIKWFVYIVFGAIIIDYLQIQIVADFITLIIQYIPLIVSAVVVLLIGLLVVDFVANTTSKILSATGVDEKIADSFVGGPLKATKTSSSGIIAGLIKLFGYLFFIAVAASILQLDLITDFLISITIYIPRLFVGVVILIIGLLSVDFLMDYVQLSIKEMKVEGAEMIAPLLRGFLFLVVVLIALDTMLVNTGILYTFLRPLGWGIAVVVAFKWGVKDAIVSYAKERGK
ncbi:flagellar biosynthesis protein FlhB [Methanohalophilus levihalophilus]|uniref:mechanosensitive ion channel family protein n=1 Tax=Methanohalophilus levihalophilus TaxID=1431282 RepID=UPI001AE527BC|nr:hypothetical protein [Methanohalophilus levihalophilus]MBP2030402.1 flagellar biosynthesis protein FlhB [Methanohalophilus levihalophilus]